MPNPHHLTAVELTAGLDHIRKSPADNGRLEMIVARPRENERVILEAGQLDLDQGLVGDCWVSTSGRYSYDGKLDPETQINIMNARVAALVAQSQDRWQLAGDQLYVDFDLSETNAPPGTRLQIGPTILEITPEPHTGCKKFVARFGLDAMKFVNSDVGKQLHLRGVNAKVIQAGAVCVGDSVTKFVSTLSADGNLQQEVEDIYAEIRASFAEMENGGGRPLREVDAELRAKHGFAPRNDSSTT